MTLSSVGYVIGSGKDAPATHLPIGIPATRWPNAGVPRVVRTRGETGQTELHE